MKRLAMACIAAITLQAQAVDWLCTTLPQARAVATSQESSDGMAAAVGTKRPARARRQIDRLDLVQAYSGQPVLLGSTWLLAVMLPASHPDTRQAFGELGLNPEATERMASGAGLIDRGIRIVQTPEQLANKLATNPPAVGYAGFFSGGRDVAPCF